MPARAASAVMVCGTGRNRSGSGRGARDAAFAALLSGEGVAVTERGHTPDPGVAGGEAEAVRNADNALAPGEIPARGWWLVLVRAAGHLVTARLPLLSAGVAFFAVLSIAPVLVTALSV